MPVEPEAFNMPYMPIDADCRRLPYFKMQVRCLLVKKSALITDIIFLSSAMFCIITNTGSLINLIIAYLKKIFF
jgi:hypothetical protein